MKHLSQTLLLFVALFCISAKVSAQSEKQVSLNHIAMYIHDLQKSTGFYKNIIGLTQIPEPFHDGKHSWFRIGAHSQLHLIEGAESVTEHDKNSHICFTVASIEEFISKLQKNDIWFGDWQGATGKITVRPDKVQQIYFKDPDGYWIEINNDTF
jgi:lactoylglutathione lyase